MDDSHHVRICEMSPRDGLQVLNRSAQIRIEDRVRLVERLQRAKLPYIEAGAFVSPKRIPAMADTAELFQRLTPNDGELAALVPNMRYYQVMSEASNVTTCALFVSASSHYAQKNTRMTIDEALAAATEVAARATADGYKLRAHVSGAFRDLTEENNPSNLDDVARVCEALRGMHPTMTVALADTDGHATAADIGRVLESVSGVIGLDDVGVHLHDREGHGVANALLAYEQGIRCFDAAVGGIGGNPSALSDPVGNVATEALVIALEERGAVTGVDQAELLEAGRAIAAMAEAVGDPAPPSPVLAEYLSRG